MELTAKYIDKRKAIRTTLGGIRLQLNGQITHDFLREFLFRPTPYIYCPIDSETMLGMTTKTGGYVEYLLDSPEEFKGVLEELRERLGQAGHKISLLNYKTRIR
jgi:hypothetical protein